MTTDVAVDPAKLAEYVFGVTLWDTPAEILRSVMRPHSKTIVKACHSSSKTHTAAIVTALAPILGGDVVTTAPTDLQVEKQLWGDVHKLVSRSRIPPAEWGTLNLKELKLATSEWAIGFTTKAEDNGVRFQGFHAREGAFLVVIVDEALGVSPAIFEAIEGIAAGGDVRRLYLCNPTISSGPVYDIFAGDAPGWNRITIDAFDTPNLRGYTLDQLLAMSEHELYDNPVPYLVTKNWVVEKYHEWGEDNPKWQSRVRGGFPTNAPDALLSLTWLEDANRMSRVKETVGISAGIDVAGPGEDETVACLRQGDNILGIKAWSQSDPRDQVIAFLKQWLRAGLKYVAVDCAGIGWYFARDIRLALEPYGVRVRAVNVGMASEILDDRGDKKYANLKAEYYWALRDRFSEGDVRANGSLDQTTIKQLISIKYDEPKGITTIESKKDARKRGVESPDRAEAVMLAFAPDGPDADVAAAFAGAASGSH